MNGGVRSRSCVTIDDARPLTLPESWPFHRVKRGSTPSEMSESHLTGGRASLAVPLEPAQVTDGDDLPNDQPVRYIYRDDPDCDTPVLGPLDGSIWRLADEEAAWDVQDGDELTLHPLGGSDSEIIASAPQMDWLFVRLPEATCP